MVTIRELAKITGYSTSMISRVLNEYPYVDEKKRQKILEVIAETNYHPNAIARTLSLGKTHNIGVIVPYIHLSYFEQMIDGIVEAAFHHQYKVTLLPTTYDKKIEHQYLEEFSTKRYDGLIVTSRALSLEEFLAYQEYGPLIFCECIRRENVASVYVDREKVFFEMLDYFKEKGIQKIGLTIGRDEQESSSTKVLLQLARQYLPMFDEASVVQNCMDYEAGYRAGAYFYEQQPIDGIITNGDEISVGIYEFYKDKTVPLLIGQDNLLISRLLNLSTVDYHLAECGRQAFSLFIKNKKECIKIDPLLIRRV